MIVTSSDETCLYTSLGTRISKLTGIIRMHNERRWNISFIAYVLARMVLFETALIDEIYCTCTLDIQTATNSQTGLGTCREKHIAFVSLFNFIVIILVYIWFVQLVNGVFTLSACSTILTQKLWFLCCTYRRVIYIKW